MKFVYTTLISCIVLSALSAADKCVSCVEDEGARNVVSGGIQKRCRWTKGTSYSCNWFGFNCKFCRISDDADTTQIMDYCRSKSHYITTDRGTRYLQFTMTTWNLSKCQ
ncbi:MAG: hypothetical protein BYD32DRAFT_410717 [Podila humilis]|nr:MAG: hypothetical protein BYD32DRAFT_410717 [Podila humilis]